MVDRHLKYRLDTILSQDQKDIMMKISEANGMYKFAGVRPKT
jgi:hypothetical protein